MAKAIPDAVYDAALNVVAGGTRLSVCSAEPANFAGIAAVSLGNIALVGGDFTISDGDANGRKVEIGAKSLTATAAGTVDHICIDDGANLLLVTTVTSQAVTNGQAWNTPSFDFEAADPT